MLAGKNFRRDIELFWLLPWLDIDSSDFILDVGCGDGYYTSLFGKQAHKVYGIDIDANCIRVAQRAEYDNCTFFIAAAEFLPFSGRLKFHKVVGVCAMEHFDNDVRALLEMRRVVKDGGKLVMSVDSLSNRNLSHAYIDEHRKKYRINNYYTIEDVQLKLKEASFRLDAWHYLVSSRLGSSIYQLCERNKWFNGMALVLSVPITKLLLFLDKHTHRQDEGYKLVFSATAV